MKKVYTEEELCGKIDAGIPKCYWDGIDKSIQVDTYYHVMNYNEPYRGGKLDDMRIVAAERNIKID